MEELSQKLFRLRDGELQKLIPLGLILLSNSLAIQNSYIASVSGFLSQVGINKFIAVSCISYFLLLIIMAIQSLVIDRFDRITLMRRTTIAFMGTFIFLRLLFWLQCPSWINYSLFYLITEVQWLVYPLVFWIFANNLFTLAEGKRIFPLLGGWGLTGKLMGIGISTLAPNLFKAFNIQPEELITVNVIFYGIALVCLSAQSLKPIIRNTNRVRNTTRISKGKNIKQLTEDIFTDVETEEVVQQSLSTSDRLHRLREFNVQSLHTKLNTLSAPVQSEPVKASPPKEKRFKMITIQEINDTYLPGFNFVKNVPSFYYLAFSLLGLSICDAIVEFRFLAVSGQVFIDPDRYQVFYGLYRLSLTLLGLVIQIFFSGHVIEKIGLKNTFLIMPIATLSGLLWCLVDPGLASSFGTILLFRLSWDTIDESSRKSFQSLIPEDLRGRVSLFIDGYLPALGNAIGFGLVGVVVLLGIWTGFQFYFYGYLVLGFLASLTALISIWKMREIYDQSLLNWRLTRRKRAKSILDDFNF